MLLSLYDNTTYNLWGSETSAPGNLSREDDGSANSTQAGCQEDNRFLEEENVRVGLLFASKALVQLLVNPFVGPLTNRYKAGLGLQGGVGEARGEAREEGGRQGGREGGREGGRGERGGERKRE